MTDKITLYDSQKNIINGQWKLKNDDDQLIFTPNKKWNKGTFWLQFDEKLDDLAGNNLIRLFDSEMHAPVSDQQTISREFRLSFKID